MTRRILEIWYAENKRDLPFREIRDPYPLWVAEIIFQQTRINQGISYYHRFMEAFPDIASLANASTDAVLKVWQGLGYYQRARNMQEAARQIMKKGGRFPSGYPEILSLKGIGKYTAAAIASQAFQLPVPAVDGNVFRFLSRYYGIHENRNSISGAQAAEERAGQLLDPENPGRSNQALIEFGALQCIPRKPDCAACPLKDSCYAFSKGLVHALPMVPKKPKVKSRYLHYHILIANGNTLLSRRKEGDIWAGLWEFPLTETPKPTNKPPTPFPASLVLSPPVNKQSYTHLLSHQKLLIRCSLHFTNSLPQQTEYRHVPVGKVLSYAVPVVLSRYWLKLSQEGYLDGEANI